MYKINNISLENYGIAPIKLDGEDIAVKGIFDLPERVGDTHNEWPDLDSVEPFVDYYDIHLGGRTIYFRGLILGKRAECEDKLTAFKALIADFTDVVRFETPYADACIWIKKITPKFYNGGASLIIEMREPVAGAYCAIIGNQITYYSEEYSESAFKNDCASGYNGSSVQLTAVANKFTSTFSQLAANQLAIDWVKANKQLYANEQGVCTIKPTVYYNVKIIGELAKNDCGAGYYGSVVTYEMPAYKYSSTVSQLDADTKAQTALNAILTQAYANANGTCSQFPDMNEVYRATSGDYIDQHFRIGIRINTGSVYNILIYGIKVSYTAKFGDNTGDIVDGLISAINFNEGEDWEANDQAPLTVTNFNKPVASLVSSGVLRIITPLAGEAVGWIL